VRLIAALSAVVWQLLVVLNPVVIPGLRAGTCCVVLRGSLLIVCNASAFVICLIKNYFTLLCIAP